MKYTYLKNIANNNLKSGGSGIVAMILNENSILTRINLSGYKMHNTIYDKYNAQVQTLTTTYINIRNYVFSQSVCKYYFLLFKGYFR